MFAFLAGGEGMGIFYSDELPQGLVFEVNGVLVIGTKTEDEEEITKKAV